MLNMWRQRCFFHLDNSEMLIKSESMATEMLI